MSEKGHRFCMRVAVYLVEIEDKIQLANIPEVSIQNFNKMVDEIKNGQLVYILPTADDEV